MSADLFIGGNFNNRADYPIFVDGAPYAYKKHKHVNPYTGAVVYYEKPIFRNIPVVDRYGSYAWSVEDPLENVVSDKLTIKIDLTMRLTCLITMT